MLFNVIVFTKKSIILVAVALLYLLKLGQSCHICSLLYASNNQIFNPNVTTSYKILQHSPKYAARGVAQLPEPIYRHRKACHLNSLRGMQLGTLA